jgi:hypothetical protein
VQPESVVYLGDESRKPRDHLGTGSLVTKRDLIVLDRFHELTLSQTAIAARRTDPDVPARDLTYSLVVVPVAVPAISPAVAAIPAAVATTIAAAVVAIPFPVLHLVPDQIPAAGPHETANDSASTRRTNR